MSPEQARGEEVDGRADLFAFGAVLYEMATGRRAFAGATTAMVFDALLNREPHRALGLNPQLPAKLEKILQKALRKDIQQRYQSAASMLTGLKELKRELETGHTILADPAEEIARRSSEFLDSIGVLPFDNAGHDPDMEYLSDGIAETIINNLSQLEQLRVIPRATMFRYKGKKFDTARIRRELGVRLVLTGRVFRRDKQLIVGAELIDTVRESQIWGEKYDRGVDDIFVIQQDITQEIVSKLQLRLSDKERQRLTRRPTENHEAYELLLRATYHANKWTADGFRKGIDYFRKAIEADPAYAAPYVGLAYIYTMLGFFGMLRPIDAFPKAKAAANKALEIEEAIGSAHILLGMVRLLYEWDWAEAERDLQRGLFLDPNEANGRYAHGILLLARRRCEEGIAEIRTAVDLDPLCNHINYSLGLAYYWTRQYDSAIEQLQNTVELEPSFIVAQQVLALAYARKGMYGAAIEQTKKVLVLFGPDFRGHATAALIHAIAGQPGEAHRILQELRNQRSRTGAVVTGIRAIDLARVHAQLGEHDQAIEELWEAFRERASLLIFLRYTPEFDGLQGDPRFDHLLNCVGVPR